MEQNEIAETVNERIFKAFEAIEVELGRAMRKHRPYNSVHEAYAVILEELDEFWDQVKMQSADRHKESMRRELTQIATTAIRAILDLQLDGVGAPEIGAGVTEGLV